MASETWKLLNDVRKFIEAEYADPAAAPDGEWLAKEARDIHNEVCTALANGAGALSRTGAVNVRETLEAIKDAILRADPNVLTDTFWMPDDTFKGGTVVDFIDHALSALEPAAPEMGK